MIKNELKNIIGKSFVASPCADSPWVITDRGNNGEANYYKDVYGTDLETGKTVVVYMDGETCIVKDINFKNKEVVLINPDEEYIFAISFKQFQADFGVSMEI